MTQRLLFRLLLYRGVGEGATAFPGLIHFTLDPYLIMLSVKQGGIKYHFLSLWYDLTYDWTQVSRAISKHTNHSFSPQKTICVSICLRNREKLIFLSSVKRFFQQKLKSWYNRLSPIIIIVWYNSYCSLTIVFPNLFERERNNVWMNKWEWNEANKILINIIFLVK